MRHVTVALLAIVLGGCSGTPTGPLPHTATEQKALDDYNQMTPEQRIALIEKGPMPESAKAAMIKKIKDQNHLK
jgi:PBP1b-binding outer membrane lipoprotein LpoB